MSALSKEDILKKIESREESIRHIQNYLPYADGQAYYMDKQKIESLRQEIIRLKHEMESL